MIKNYFKVTLRQLLAHKLFSLINILGLSIGLACTILISFYVLDELSYDKFFPDSDRIFRLSRDYYPTDFRVNGRFPAALNAPFSTQLKTDFSQIEESARLFSFYQPVVWLDEVPVQESGFMYVDQSFTNIFGFEWLAGNPATALTDPYSLVLTESLANKYFGSENPLGQSLRFTLDDDFNMQVTGVIRDLPENTHLDINALQSMSTVTNLFGDFIFESWEGRTQFHTYIRLASGADIATLERQFPDFIDRYVNDPSIQGSGITAMKLTDIHLRSRRIEELKPPGKMINVVTFSIIAVCILLIACINFMNLSTARSSQRSKEVGMRKTIGANKKQLVQQFLGESLFLTCLAMAMAMALVLVEIVMPWFEAFVGKELSFSYVQEIQLVVALIVVVIGVGLVAGSYPAFFLSSFKPAEVLKGGIVHGHGNALLRQGLVVLQFAISIALVVATVVMYAQMKYARNFDLGIDREQVVVISGTRTQGLGTQWDAMKQKLLSHPEITHVTNSLYTPFTYDANALGIMRNQNESSGNEVIKYNAVGYDFFATYGIDLLAGRVFSDDRSTDILQQPTEDNPVASGAFIISESVARQFGWTVEEALEQSLRLSFGARVSVPIIGVTQDSYIESLTTPIEPIFYFLPPPGFQFYPSLPQGAIRITGNNVADTLTYIDDVWRDFLPEMPLNRRFLSDDFEALYSLEQKQGQMMTYFTVLAIFIACLGLYGLASFNAERRTKEIGIRKVMGGSIWNIVLLLTNDFSKLVLIANFIAWPVAWYAMNQWLANFAYRIDLTPLLFIGSGLIALCIAWVTVGGTAAKAASQRPVLALRYE